LAFLKYAIRKGCHLRFPFVFEVRVWFARTIGSDVAANLDLYTGIVKRTASKTNARRAFTLVTEVKTPLPQMLPEQIDMLPEQITRPERRRSRQPDRSPVISTQDSQMLAAAG
jgi:hypothetical protein